MRTYGRIVPDPLFPDDKQWVIVETDANGFDDMVWLTTVVQTIKLNLGESPFYANFGIPAHASVISQIAPDSYLSRIQQQFAQYFLSLIISRQEDRLDERGIPSPCYLVTAITKYGAFLSAQVPY
jgi:hypothetical protein